MRFHEVTEARKNPEQNPKVSINDAILTRLEKTTDNIGSIPNLFVSFTTVDKLGINPKSQYDTPLGIYAYPANFVANLTGEEYEMIALPFAGDAPWANIFKATGNIINLREMTSAETIPYYRELGEIWAKISSSWQPWKTAVDQIQRIVDEAREYATHSFRAGGRFWYVLMTAAQKYFSKEFKSAPPVVWNKVFRLLGIDGAVDPGEGIIHGNEPNQAVFFNINAITDLTRVANKYSPKYHAGRKEEGKYRTTAAHEISEKYKDLSPTEAIAAISADEDKEDTINYIRSQPLRAAILAAFPNLLAYVKRPTASDQYSALVNSQDMIVLKLMRSTARLPKPRISDGVLIKALEVNPRGAFNVTIYQRRPSLPLQLALIELGPDYFDRYVRSQQHPHAKQVAMKKAAERAQEAARGEKYLWAAIYLAAKVDVVAGSKEDALNELAKYFGVDRSKLTDANSSVSVIKKVE